jgi:membrane associated rhomboid family serine protease
MDENTSTFNNIKKKDNNIIDNINENIIKLKTEYIKIKKNVLYDIFYVFNLENQINQQYPIIIPLICILIICIHIYGSIKYNFNFITGYYSIDELIELEGLYYPIDIIDNIEIWEYFTYSILHSGFYHLINNVITILLFGSYLEVKYKWYRVITIYIFSCIGSSIIYCTINKLSYNNDEFVLIGASGGTFGLMGCLISEFYLNWEKFNNKSGRILLIILIIFSHLYEYTLDNSNIASGVHLGGLIYGISPAVLYLPNYKYEYYEWIFIVLAIIINLIYFIICPIYLYI